MINLENGQRNRFKCELCALASVPDVSSPLRYSHCVLAALLGPIHNGQVVCSLRRFWSVRLFKSTKLVHAIHRPKDPSFLLANKCCFPPMGIHKVKLQNMIVNTQDVSSDHCIQNSHVL